MDGAYSWWVNYRRCERKVSRPVRHQQTAGNTDELEYSSALFRLDYILLACLLCSLWSVKSMAEGVHVWGQGGYKHVQGNILRILSGYI